MLSALCIFLAVLEKEKWPFIPKKCTSHYHGLRSCFRNPMFKFRTEQKDVCLKGSVVLWIRVMALKLEYFN